MKSVKIKAVSEDALLYLLYKNCHLGVTVTQNLWVKTQRKAEIWSDQKKIQNGHTVLVIDPILLEFLPLLNEITPFKIWGVFLFCFVFVGYPETLRKQYYTAIPHLLLKVNSVNQLGLNFWYWKFSGSNDLIGSLKNLRNITPPCYIQCHQ